MSKTKSRKEKQADLTESVDKQIIARTKQGYEEAATHCEGQEDMANTEAIAPQVTT